MDAIDGVLRRTSLVAPDEAAIARLGWRLAAQFFAWGHGVALPLLIDCLAGRTGLSEQAPLARTARALGPALLRWGGHPYHSLLHHAEVATCAMVLAALAPEPLPPEHLGLLLCAALAHDLEFDPAHAATARFAAEWRSAEALEAIAAAAGVAAPERQTLRLLILSTEKFARNGLRALLRHAYPHPDVALRRLGETPDMLALAALLSDADLLPASGLTEGWQARQQDRLAREWGRAVTRTDQLVFFRDIVGPDYLSPGGGRFDANLARIRAATLAEVPGG